MIIWSVDFVQDKKKLIPKELIKEEDLAKAKRKALIVTICVEGGVNCMCL